MGQQRSQEKTARLLAFARDRWRGDVDLRIEDAYKWLFHATQGGEHAITDPEGPRAWLEREWATLGKPLPGDRLVEPLRPDAAVVRLHLRPFRAQGGKPDELLTAFVVSARAFRADRTGFAAVWRALGDALKAEPLNKALTRADWERLERETASEGYPAIHHSAHYEAVRKPAYRVLTAEQAKRLAKKGDRI
jgi:hypothetical protein